MDTATLLWSVLFGAVGAGYFLYGKKQKAWVPLSCGLALMVFPYFIANVWLLVGVGLLLCGVPFFYRP